MKHIRIDTETKTIHFSGLSYSQWGHIRWLREQLAILETNAEALWGKELKAAIKEIDEKWPLKADEKSNFTVIDGGKEES